MPGKVLVAGETLIDFIPDQAGVLREVESFSRRAGGAPANVAVGLARLGEVPWFWTRVGTDHFGDFLVRRLRQDGIPDRFVERDSEAKTSLAFVAHDEDRGPEFSFYRDGTADTRMAAGRVPDQVLHEIEWVYVGGVPFSSESSRSAMFDLIHRAKSESCAVVFDPNARSELWTDFDFSASVEEILPDVDVVKTTPSDLNEAGITAESGELLAENLFEYGPHTVLITEGESGSEAFSTSDSPWGVQTATHDGYSVDTVDTTGAGDAFTAGVLTAFANGEQDFDQVLEFANAVAAVTTVGRGAMTALPDQETVCEFRENQTE